jgi:hypothetical protein
MFQACGCEFPISERGQFNGEIWRIHHGHGLAL